MQVTVTFTVDTDSELHAKEVVRRYFAGKGVHPKGEEELTLGRKEPRWGYDGIEVKGR
jgi:hypothetical protein